MPRIRRVQRSRHEMRVALARLGPFGEAAPVVRCPRRLFDEMALQRCMEFQQRDGCSCARAADASEESREVLWALSTVVEVSRRKGPPAYACWICGTGTTRVEGGACATCKMERGSRRRGEIL